MFSIFDTDGTGLITTENVQLAFQKLGQDLSLEEVQQIINEHDSSKDGQISFDEFKAIFLTKSA